MKIDRRITNGLAWTGALLVVAIPTADLLSAQFIGSPAPAAPAVVAAVAPEAPLPMPSSQRPSTPAAKPATEVASIEPVKAAPVAKPAATAKPVEVAAKPAASTPAAKPAGNAVDTYLGSGKPLPSYITDADAPAKPAEVAATPARPPIDTSSAVVDPVQVASIPVKVAPTPMPLSMRPRPVTVATAPVVAPSEPVLILPTPTQNAPVVRPPVQTVPQGVDVTAADLADWESGPLSEFLARRQGGNASAASYDNNGFYLDQGPDAENGGRDRLIGPATDEYYFPFGN
jgi:hypothetical protein